MGYELRDKSLEVTKALPNGAAAVTSDGIDLVHSQYGEFHAAMELEIDAPILTTAELPNTETLTYDLEHDTASDFSGATTLAKSVLVQTGAGGTGAAAATARFRPPVVVKRYVRLKATNSGAGNASGKSATLRGRF